MLSIFWVTNKVLQVCLSKWLKQSERREGGKEGEMWILGLWSKGWVYVKNRQVVKDVEEREMGGEELNNGSWQ